VTYYGGQGSTIPLPDRAPAGQVHSQDHAPDQAFRPGIAAVVTALAYFIGAKVGFALTFQPHPISALWPPNAVLLAALLLTPVRSWWLILAAALPVHLAAEVQSGFPVPMVLGWFVSNCSEALIGASLIRHLAGRQPRFESFRYVSVFMLCGALIAPVLSSFIDVALIKFIGGGQINYWELVKLRLLSNALAALVIVPPAVSWTGSVSRRFRDASPARRIEGGALFAGMFITGVFIFIQEVNSTTIPARLYLPFPFLLWATVRFGTRGISICLLLVTGLAIWGALHGQGPFASVSATESTRSLQLFLIVVAVPLLLLAAVMEERKKARDALQISEERSLKIFRASPDPIVIVRKSDLTIIDVNEKWEALFGHRRADAIGRTTVELGLYANPEDRGTYLDLSARGLVRDFAVDMRDRNGQVHHTVLAGDSVEVAGTDCLITIVRDVTAQKLIEREAQQQRLELMHLSRVAMLGELSGALAHELNQPLTAILSNAQAAQRLLARDRIDAQDLPEILGDIVAEGRRASEVICRLRALFKKSGTQFQALDINDLVVEVLMLAHGNLTTREINVVTELSAHPVVTHGDRIQLQQVLLNVVVNACEAMEASGSARELTIKTTPSGDGLVQIIVVDSGPGIPAESMEKLFEPFFTTKPHGLGLGLSISRSIIEAHDGKLLVRNNPDRGATFRILLPVSVGDGA
jgi:two-component system sensor kinase FixL